MMSQERLDHQVATMTIDAWGALEEDVRGELVDGRLVEEETGSFLHELAVVWLSTCFKVWLSGRGGFVFGSDAKFAVRPTRGRKPDLSVFLAGTPKPPRHGVCRTPPDIMVEVITATPKDARRDRIEKLREYAAFGVRYYWLLDPVLQTLEILELGADGRYVHALDASAGRLEPIPGCEGLVIDLDALWREAAELEAEALDEA
jgi:Uma2 family endonuclease